MTRDEYEAGDVLRVRGHEYEVDRVGTVTHTDEVLYYKIEPVDDDGDAPPARLDPIDEDGEPIFVLTEYHRVDPDDVEVVD